MFDLVRANRNATRSSHYSRVRVYPKGDRARLVFQIAPTAAGIKELVIEMPWLSNGVGPRRAPRRTAQEHLMRQMLPCQAIIRPCRRTSSPVGADPPVRLRPGRLIAHGEFVMDSVAVRCASSTSTGLDPRAVVVALTDLSTVDATVNPRRAGHLVR